MTAAGPPHGLRPSINVPVQKGVDERSGHRSLADGGRPISKNSPSAGISIDGGGEARRPRADDQDVVEIVPRIDR
jgi:hypothetical protein